MGLTEVTKEQLPGVMMMVMMQMGQAQGMAMQMVAPPDADAAGPGGYPALQETKEDAKELDFTSDWKSQHIPIPRGQRIGDLWTIKGTFGARERFFAVNFLCSSNSDLPMQFVPKAALCECTRRCQGKWSGGGASGPQRPFDTEYGNDSNPNASSACKVAPRKPFYLQINVEADGYRCTLQADEQDESPVVVCYAHRDPVSKTGGISLTCEAYDDETYIKSFTLSRQKDESDQGHDKADV